MKIGYARISTEEQNTDLQHDALEAAGCEKIFTDVISGAKSERPRLNQLREQLRPGDTVVVWRLDRLSRSLSDLIEWVQFFEKEKVGFQSLQENMDTSSAGGKFIFHVFGAMAEFERNLIKDRTNAGLAAARARGRVGGRPEKLNAAKKAMALQLYNDERNSIKEICSIMGVSKSTLFRFLGKTE
ncbi:recombinase family protein [Runella sp.]|uniref:recombinase family protein n=1 Tax=Runella sp. TaxID=1960881 RepID=UPI00301A61FB